MRLYVFGQRPRAVVLVRGSGTRPVWVSTCVSSKLEKWETAAQASPLRAGARQSPAPHATRHNRRAAAPAARPLHLAYLHFTPHWGTIWKQTAHFLNVPRTRHVSNLRCCHPGSERPGTPRSGGDRGASPRGSPSKRRTWCCRNGRRCCWRERERGRETYCKKTVSQPPPRVRVVGSNDRSALEWAHLRPRVAVLNRFRGAQRRNRREDASPQQPRGRPVR